MTSPFHQLDDEDEGFVAEEDIAEAPAKPSSRSGSSDADSLSPTSSNETASPLSKVSKDQSAETPSPGIDAGMKMMMMEEGCGFEDGEDDEKV